MNCVVYPPPSAKCGLGMHRECIETVSPGYETVSVISIDRKELIEVDVQAGSMHSARAQHQTRSDHRPRVSPFCVKQADTNRSPYGSKRFDCREKLVCAFAHIAVSQSLMSRQGTSPVLRLVKKRRSWE